MGIAKVAIDTNIAIEVLNNNALTLSSLHAFDVIYLPVIVCGELIFGAKNSSGIRYNLPRYESFISDCEILEANLSVSSKYAVFKQNLKQLAVQFQRMMYGSLLSALHTKYHSLRETGVFDIFRC